MLKKRHYSICLTALAALAIFLFTTAPARAHYPWLLLEDGIIPPGKSLKWVVGYGHRFPLAGFMDGESLEETLVIGPGGTQKMEGNDLSGKEFTTPDALTQEGGYVLAVKRKSGFVTKTTEGYKRQPKKGLKGVLSSSYSHTCLKAIANVGDAGGKVDAVAGHVLEIVPLANPRDLRPGDELPIKVLFKGKPFKTQILATYAGFSMEKEVFAYAATTNNEGLGKIRILDRGSWIIRVKHEHPYANPEMCDTEKYLANCTFEIR